LGWFSITYLGAVSCHLERHGNFYEYFGAVGPAQGAIPEDFVVQRSRIPQGHDEGCAFDFAVLSIPQMGTIKIRTSRQLLLKNMPFAATWTERRAWTRTSIQRLRFGV
jgi:hypothetical protein